MASSPAAATTFHTCNPDGSRHALPFGRRAAPGVCARCDELRNGAAPRVAWGVRNYPKGYSALEAQRRDVAAHFASEKHRSGGCGPICTYGDW